MTDHVRSPFLNEEQSVMEMPRLLGLQAELGRVLLAADSLPEMLKRCAELIVKDLGASFARIWTLNEGENVLELQASAGLYTHLNGPHSRIAVGQYKIGKIAQERKPHLTNDVIGDPRVSDQEWARREGMVSFAGYPLLAGEQLLGVLGMFSKKALPETALDALAAAANFIALGIQRKVSEESLRENVEFTQTILASSSECVKILDLNFHIKYMNPGGMKVLEIEDFGSCENFNWVSFWREEDMPAVMVAVNEALAGGTGTFHAFCPTFKDTPKWWDVVLSPIRDAEGRVVKLLASSRDVTERKQIEIVGRETTAKLAAMVDEQTADLRHEIGERRKAEEELRALSSKLLTLRDNEQRRIARDLHDSVGQLLAAIAMSLAVVSEESTKLSSTAEKSLSSSVDLVHETVREIRVVSQLLHPPLLDEAGISAALRVYAEGISARGSLKVDLHIAEDFGRLSIEMETAIFRIVQECLTNIYRHSGSKTARIELARLRDEVRVEISDQGKGMPESKSLGVGLRGMKERVAQFGGDVAIHSSGMGTTVVARLPLTPATSEHGSNSSYELGARADF